MYSVAKEMRYIRLDYMYQIVSPHNYVVGVRLWQIITIFFCKTCG